MGEVPFTKDKHGQPITVTFKARGPSERVWSVIFDLGDETENASAALREAWKLNAAIVGVSP